VPRARLFVQHVSTAVEIVPTESSADGAVTVQ